MIKQDYHIVNQCRCQKGRNEYKTIIPSANLTESSVAENEYVRCGCSRTDSFRPDYQQDKPPCLDRQTLNALSSFRQRACRFINSESEITSSNSDVNCITCKNGNCRNEGNALQKAQELINYAPESAFLKKMKEQCQYFQDNNNREVQNVFSTCGQESDFVPYVCDKCVAKSKQILKLSEQLNSGRTKYSPNDSKTINKSCRSICTDQQSKTSGLDFIEKTCRSAVNEYQRSLANIGMNRDDDDVFCQTQSNVVESLNQNKSKDKKEKSNKKSHHLSRSKKPKKRFHRRKRKSNESGNDEPQENLEPSLKRPFDNSCERCWRYASPARSPVNKPDQRFDPNFRRAHSATDFPVTDENDKSDSDGQGNLRRRPSIRRKETNRPRTPAREQYSTNTQVKELMHEPLELSYHEPLQPVSERSHQRAQNVFDNRVSKSPENRGSSYSGLKPRPKTSYPGSRTRDRCLSFDFDDLDVTQYKDIAIGSNRQGCGTANCGKKFVKNNLEPQPSSSREHLRSVRGAFERSRSSPKYSTHSRSSRNNEDANQEICGSGHAQVDPNFTSQPSYREVLLPQNSRRSPRMPVSGYSGTEKGNQFLLNNQHDPCCSGREDSDVEPLSHMQHFQAIPAAKTQSSVNIQDQFPRFEKRKPQSAGVGMTRRDCWNYQNISSAFGLEINQGKLRPHPFRACDCRTQQIQTEGIDYPVAGCAVNNMCCHCRWIGNSCNNSNRPSCFNTRRESQDGCSHYEPPTNPDFRSCDKHFPSNPDPSKCNQRNVSAFRNGNVDYNSPQDQSDRVIPCPYQQYISNKACLRNHNCSGNSETRDDENYSPVDRRSYRNYTSNETNYSPKKYCVFYMTKNKEETGNDVEVLIEELTQRCSRGTKGSKTKSLKEKMKRLMECQSESMALRFQKGVSDTGKNLQSSRVLYF